MTYLTIGDLSARLGDGLYARLTDRVAGHTASDAIAQAIVDEAEALANSYLARRFRTPLDLVAHPELADVLRGRVLDLCEYLAWRGSPFVSDLPGRVLTLFEDARRWFEQIAQGRADLPADRPPAAAESSTSGPQYASPPRSFTHDLLDGL